MSAYKRITPVGYPDELVTELCTIINQLRDIEWEFQKNQYPTEKYRWMLPYTQTIIDMLDRVQMKMDKQKEREMKE